MHLTIVHSASRNGIKVMGEILVGCRRRRPWGHSFLRLLASASPVAAVCVFLRYIAQDTRRLARFVSLTSSSFPSVSPFTDRCCCCEALPLCNQRIIFALILLVQMQQTQTSYKIVRLWLVALWLPLLLSCETRTTGFFLIVCFAYVQCAGTQDTRARDTTSTTTYVAVGGLYFPCKHTHTHVFRMCVVREATATSVTATRKKNQQQAVHVRPLLCPNHGADINSSSCFMFVFCACLHHKLHYLLFDGCGCCSMPLLLLVRCVHCPDEITRLSDNARA